MAGQKHFGSLPNSFATTLHMLRMIFVSVTA